MAKGRMEGRPEEKPSPDVLEQQIAVPGFSDSAEDDDVDEIAAAVERAEADPADVLDQHRSVPMTDEDAPS